MLLISKSARVLANHNIENAANVPIVRIRWNSIVYIPIGRARVEKTPIWQGLARHRTEPGVRDRVTLRQSRNHGHLGGTITRHDLIGRRNGRYGLFMFCIIRLL